MTSAPYAVRFVRTLRAVLLLAVVAGTCLLPSRAGASDDLLSGRWSVTYGEVDFARSTGDVYTGTLVQSTSCIPLGTVVYHLTGSGTHFEGSAIMSAGRVAFTCDRLSFNDRVIVDLDVAGTTANLTEQAERCVTCPVGDTWTRVSLPSATAQPAGVPPNAGIPPTRRHHVPTWIFVAAALILVAIALCLLTQLLRRGRRRQPPQALPYPSLPVGVPPRQVNAQDRPGPPPHVTFRPHPSAAPLVTTRTAPTPGVRLRFRSRLGSFDLSSKEVK